MDIKVGDIVKYEHDGMQFNGEVEADWIDGHHDVTMYRIVSPSATYIVPESQILCIRLRPKKAFEELVAKSKERAEANAKSLGFDLVTEWPDYEPTDSLGIPKHLTTKSLKECECGAKHTSFPNDHLSFCPMND